LGTFSFNSNNSSFQWVLSCVKKFNFCFSIKICVVNVFGQRIPILQSTSHVDNFFNFTWVIIFLFLSPIWRDF
jgi:hypothetical protein